MNAASSKISGTRRPLLFVLAWCAALAGQLGPLTAEDVPMPADFHPVRRRIEAGIRDGLAPSLALAVVKEGRVVWAEGFGFADLDRRLPATADSIYLLASVSKPITATGLMVLVERGQIDLDRPANDYLPGAKLRARAGKAEDMTVRRLANHTAGLPVHFNFFHAGSEPPPWDETILRYGFAARGPGARWVYSNLAYGLLGYITETSSGKPWREFLEREVFDPIGMTRTSDRVRPGREGNATVQYSPDAAGRFVRVEPYRFDHPGASTIWSSASDLARFARLHLHGGSLDGVRLLTEKSALQMQRLSSEREPGKGTGVGWSVEPCCGRRCFFHTGGMPGVSTVVRCFPDERAAIVVLTNTDRGTLSSDVTRRLADALFGEEERERAPQGTQAADAGDDGAIAGRWEGKLEHIDGDIAVRMEVRRPDRAEITFGGRSPRNLEDVAWSRGVLTGAIRSPLRTQSGFHGIPRLGLQLERDGDRLTGICVAEAEGYFALSHWVELERRAVVEEAPAARDPAGRESSTSPGPFDLLIRGGRVVDGTGAPFFHADVGIRAGRIAAVGRLSSASASRVLDAAGLVVAPGFIDMMGQTAVPLLKDPGACLNLLTQGITTINAGEGDSDAPLGEEEGRKAGWRTMREFFEVLERTGLPLNVAQTVGHTQVRSLVVGLEDRQAAPGEMERMRALVREAMEAGAIGLSTSLIYPPAIYGPEEEIVELARVAGEHGGRYFTHMRNEGDRLLEAIDEALRIGKAARAPVHIFHLKTAGRANWGKMDAALERLRAARAAGQEVSADIYPYVNNGLGIRSFIHPRHSAKGPGDLVRRLADPALRAQMRREMEEEGAWENWYAHAGRDWSRVVLGRIEHPAYGRFNGQSLGAIAESVKEDPWEVFFAIAATGAFAMPETMCEENKVKAMREPFVSFDTDVGPAGGSGIASHPRAYGSFPRVFARYVRELKVLALEEAVQRMTAVPANEVFAFDRGRMAPGLAADLVVFDPDAIRDSATFARPDLPSDGVKFVLVNGVVVLEDGKYTGARPGKVLLGPGWSGR